MKVNEVVHSCVAKRVFWSLPSMGIVFFMVQKGHFGTSPKCNKIENALFYNDILMILRIHRWALLANPNFDWIFIVFYSVSWILLCEVCRWLQIVHVKIVNFILSLIVVFGNIKRVWKLTKTQHDLQHAHVFTREAKFDPTTSPN